MSPHVWAMSASQRRARGPNGGGWRCFGCKLARQTTARLAAQSHDRRSSIAKDNPKRNQATTRDSGGSSMRAARRSGNSHPEGRGGRRRPSEGLRCAQDARDAALPIGPVEGDGGSAGLRQGVALTQGFALPSGAGTEGATSTRAVVVFSPQQHDAPLHAFAQSQWSACSSASKSEDARTRDGAAARLSRPNAIIATTGISQRRTAFDREREG